eukprot:scaffold932_cov207-Alexandrium_tamarense.AAC.3
MELWRASVKNKKEGEARYGQKANGYPLRRKKINGIRNKGVKLGTSRVYEVGDNFCSNLPLSTPPKRSCLHS